MTPPFYDRWIVWPWMISGRYRDTLCHHRVDRLDQSHGFQGVAQRRDRGRLSRRCCGGHLSLQTQTGLEGLCESELYTLEMPNSVARHSALLRVRYYSLSALGPVENSILRQFVRIEPDRDVSLLIRDLYCHQYRYRQPSVLSRRWVSAAQQSFKHSARRDDPVCWPNIVLLLHRRHAVACRWETPILLFA